jgi:hypothetical protein
VKAQNGVEDDDDQDGDGVLEVADGKRDRRGHDEDDDHHFGKLCG